MSESKEIHFTLRKDGSVVANTDVAREFIEQNARGLARLGMIYDMANKTKGYFLIPSRVEKFDDSLVQLLNTAAVLAMENNSIDLITVADQLEAWNKTNQWK